MDVVTVGESMVLLEPEDGESLEHATRFRKRVAGAESNVAIALARLGHRVSWISKVGADGFGRYVTKTIRGEGVDVSGVLVDGQKSTGVFFKEHSPAHGRNVQYYRAHSAASEMDKSEIDSSVMQSARVFHVTGITPALSLANRNMILALLEEARHFGVLISFDPNIRQKLWPLGKAIPTLAEMANYADVVLPGLDEGEMLTNQTTPEGIAEWFVARGSQIVVVKLGRQGAYFQTENERGYVPGFAVTEVDEIGAGDAFAAGLLSGLLDSLDIREAVLRACALGAIAVCGRGDYETLPNREELSEFMSRRASTVKR
ncbi:sugar kinase [Alicyclobacillus acidiphilus]|uniref:sugar kinase n=1 Tax=Alicyclobacillus acidiphilus TaxID=182455 RepID=UPI000830A1CF|nr:sugar kinase [Alicyclobacillus acidiphilus]